MYFQVRYRHHNGINSNVAGCFQLFYQWLSQNAIVCNFIVPPILFLNRLQKIATTSVAPRYYLTTLHQAPQLKLHNGQTNKLSHIPQANLQQWHIRFHRYLQWRTYINATHNPTPAWGFTKGVHCNIDNGKVDTSNRLSADSWLPHDKVSQRRYFQSLAVANSLANSAHWIVFTLMTRS